MLNYIREGDAVIVHSMDRLARNLDDLRQIVKQLTEKKITIQFIKENLIFTCDNNNPMSNLLLSVMGSFAEFERLLIRERQREGIEIVKKKGLYKGRKPCLSDEQITQIRTRVASGEKKTAIALSLGISRETLYQYLRKNINSR